jgi:hypothetical protein
VGVRQENQNAGDESDYSKETLAASTREGE